VSINNFEVHRAIVHSSDTVTGEAQVRIPSLLGAGQVVSIPTTGLTQVSGYWNVPSPGASTFIAVSADRTQFLWVTAVTTPSSGDDRDVVDSLQFNIDSGIVVDTEGLLAWNEDWGTVDIGLHGSNAVLHVGQQVYYYAKNQTGAQIDKGTVVRFDGALGASGHIKMAPFLADGTYPSEYIMGVTAHDILDGDDGYVVHFGAVRGVDTATPGWSAGDVVYASPTITGGLTSTTPSAPNNIILVAAVVNSHAQNGELFVRPTLAANILNDEGIVYTNLADNDVLVYDSTDEVFKNEPQSILTNDAGVTYTNLADNDVLSYNSTTGVFENTSSLDLTTITTTGSVGIGTSSPSFTLDVFGTGRFYSNLRVDGNTFSAGHFTAQTGGADGGIVLGQTFNSSYVGLRTAGMSETASSEYVIMSDGTNTYVSSGTGGLTYLRGPANNTSNEITLTSSGVIIDGTTTFRDDAFFENAVEMRTDASVSGRLYIGINGIRISDSSGNFDFNAPIQYDQYLGTVLNGGTNNDFISSSDAAYGGYGGRWNFHFDNSLTTGTGNAAVTAGRFYAANTSVGSTSDARLKKNIADFDNEIGLHILRQLRPRTFEWDYDDPTGLWAHGTQIGLVAQEVDEVFPAWVDYWPQEDVRRKSDGEIVERALALGLDQQFQVMVVAAIQNLADRIEALETV